MKSYTQVLFGLTMLGTAAWGQTDQTAAIRQAVEKGLPAMQKAGPEFFKKSGCASCHHQSLPAMVTSMAQERGIAYDRATQERDVQAVLAFLKPAQEVFVEGSDVVPQVPATASYMLMGLAAQHYPADDLTTSMVHNIAMRQKPDGSWTGWSPRPPISGGDIRETVICIRSLDLYAPKGRRAEFDARIAKARQWLLQAKPDLPEENISRLLGLAWAKAAPEQLHAAAAEVLSLQRPDGGWAQLTTRTSDAYATGEALFALYQAGALKTEDPAYQRGVRYLLDTQEADGSWHVKTRAIPFQKLVDSGYPHGRDQWISIAGSSWASMALMLAVR